MDQRIDWKLIEMAEMECMTLKISTNNLNDLVTSLLNLNLLDKVAYVFSGRLMRIVFRQVVLHGAVLEVENDVLVVKKQQERSTGSLEVENSKRILQNIERAIHFIGGALTKDEGGRVLLKAVGAKVGTELFELVSKEVVEARSYEDMAVLEDLLSSVERCKNSAIKYHLIGGDILSLHSPAVIC